MDLNVEDYSDEKAERYLFVRFGLTGRSPQFYATFSEKKRLLGVKGKGYAVWLSLRGELANLPKENLLDCAGLKSKLDEVFKTFYDGKTYTLKEPHAKKLEEYFREHNLKDSGKRRNVAFYTVKIDGEPVVHDPCYRALVRKEAYGKVERGEATCHLCGRDVREYISDFARFPLKFYINKQKGYSQYLTDAWEGNFVLCKECYEDVFAGYKAVQNYLDGALGGIRYMIIPEFVGDIPEKVGIEELTAHIKTSYNPFRVAEEVAKIDRDLRTQIDEGYFNLTYIFYDKNNQDLQVFGVIKDVPKGRIKGAIRRVDDVRDVFRELLGDDYLMTKFSDIYYLVPLRVSRGKLLDLPKMVSLFDHLINGREISARFLTGDFVRVIRAKYYGNPEFHNTQWEANADLDQGKRLGSVVKYVLKSNQLLLLAGKKGGLSMDTLEKIPQEYREYLKRAKFNEKEAALFLLGVVIERIGSQQFIKYGHKPILNKINYEGMNLERLKILYNEVMDKLHELRAYDVEHLYALSKEIFDLHLKEWDLTPQENVYFLLSGYAFASALRKEKKQEVRDEEQ